MPKLKNDEPQTRIINVSSLFKSERANYVKNQEIARRFRPNLFKKNLSLYFSQYCHSTTIHGMKYVGQRGRYFIEKIIWTIVITLMFIVCFALIQKTYVKWRNSPVILTFAATETSISEIPFPAITICPDAKFDPEVFSFTKTVMKIQNSVKLSKTEKDLLQAALLICTDVFEKMSLKVSVHKNCTIEPQLLYQILSAMSSFDPLSITTFNWLNENISHPTSTIITSEGLCQSFNMLAYDEIFRIDNLYNNSSNPGEKIRKWSLEDGYPPSENLDSYPRRTFVSGVEGGFEADALFTNHSHLDCLCEQSLQGYKVVIHHPSEMPNMLNHFRLPLDKAVLVAVKPTMITVSKELLDYEPEIRQCYFAREKYLSMYKLYTQENCLDECLANYTLAHCKCVPFYMPFNDYDSPICGPGSDACVRESEIKYLEMSNSSDLSNQSCGCLPSCTSLSYNIEISQTNWDWKEMFDVFRILAMNTTAFPNTTSSHFSRLVVYYKDLQFVSVERKKMYGFVDFFSNTGGILALFIGFSVTSVIEILYFLTLRVICNIKKYGKDTWSGEPELINAE